MGRPTPNWKFLTDLALWVHDNLYRELAEPVLLTAVPDGPYAVVSGRNLRELHILDVKKRKLVRQLQIPRNTRLGTDYRRFIFSEGNLSICGYDTLSHHFTVWSLSDGNLLFHTEGEGQIKPAMCFMPGGRLAVCDGPKINTYSNSGELMYYTPVSDDMRSVVLFSRPSPKPTVVAVGVFRKGLGGHTLHSFIIENGMIIGREEGPYRPRAQNADDNKIVQLFELLNIPGATQRILIVAEEETLERRAKNTDWEFDCQYTTRLVPVNPQNGAFLDGEIEIAGQHCLDIERHELVLTDELGRRRRVTAFPLKLEIADWRLAG